MAVLSHTRHPGIVAVYHCLPDAVEEPGAGPGESVAPLPAPAPEPSPSLL
jgi:hypothetical protein